MCRFISACLIIYFLPNLATAQVEVTIWYDPDQKSLVKEVYYTKADDPGIRIGTYKKYHVSGGIMVRGSFEDGFKQGVFEEFYQNGSLQRTIPYQLGEKNGAVEVYDIHGNIIQKAFYQNLSHSRLIVNSTIL